MRPLRPLNVGERGQNVRTGGRCAGGDRYARRHGTRRPWLVQLMERRTMKVAAVALATKTPCTLWT